MKVEDFTQEESNDAPVVRMNKEQRTELGVKVGDKVKVIRTTVEMVEAEVHQARVGQIDEIRLIGGAFEETKDPEVEIKKLDEVDAEVDDDNNDGNDDNDDDDGNDDDFEEPEQP